MDLSDPNTNRPPGWEHLFQQGVFPPRYQTTAAPNQSVVEWAAALPAAARVLDVGCGVGRHVVNLGGRGFRLAGVDVSPSGVEQTRTACAERGIAFDGRVAEMTRLPWDDQTFDAVLSTSTICHHRLSDMRRALAEIRRVLKPGGWLLVDFLHKATRSYQQAREQVEAGRLSEVEPDTFIDESREPDLTDDAFLPHHYCDKAEVQELLMAFEILRIEADFSDQMDESGLPRRGYWVASARKPRSG
jgi:SAM-dependent methyltransferase